MEIILVREIEGLGAVGDVVKVKDGYAHNFLIPKGLAKAATKANMNTIEEEKKKLRRLEEKKKEEFLQLAEKINNAANDIHIDRHTIQLEEPIKKLGVYQVLVKIHPEITATLKVWVVKE